MSEEDLTNYKTFISNFDITKYVVLDKESNYWYSAEYVDEMLKKQDKEIEILKKLVITLSKSIQELSCNEEELELLNNILGSDKE